MEQTAKAGRSLCPRVRMGFLKHMGRLRIAQHLRFLLVESDAIQIYTVAGRKPTAIHILKREKKICCNLPCKGCRWREDGAGAVNPQSPQKNAKFRHVPLSFPALGEQRQEVPRLTE